MRIRRNTMRLLFLATVFGFLASPSSAQSRPDNGTTLDGNKTAIVKEASPQESALRSGAMNLDLNYPGVGVRYFFSGKMALEGRVQDGGGNLAVGPRLYLFYPGLFSARSKFSPYLCAEADYISFKGTPSKGNGYGGGAFAGVEYSLNQSFSMQIDTGGLYLALKDKSTSLSQNDLEFTLNFGVNYYFKSGNSQLPEVP